MDGRVALIGYGLAGRVIHRPLIAAQGDLRITHVVTSDAGRGAQCATDLPDAVLLGSAQELWDRHADFDAVVVATANNAHAPQARAAIDLGKATVVDKPLATTPEAAAELADHAAAHGVPLTVFHNRRWDSDTVTAQALIAEGRLGTVLRLESRYARFRPEVAVRWKETVPAGGGVLLDLGPHLVDQALLLLGPATSIYAEVQATRPGAVVDDDCFLALTHASGARSHLWASLVSPRPGPRLVVQGRQAGYQKDDVDGQEDALRDGWVPGQPGPQEPDGLLYDERGAHPVPSRAGDWASFYRTFAAAMEKGPVPVPASDGVQVIRVLAAAVHSAVEGRVIAL